MDLRLPGTDTLIAIRGEFRRARRLHLHHGGSCRSQSCRCQEINCLTCPNMEARNVWAQLTEADRETDLPTNRSGHHALASRLAFCYFLNYHAGIMTADAVLRARGQRC